MPKPIKLSEFSDALKKSVLEQFELMLTRPMCNTKLDFKLDISDIYKERYGKENVILNITAEAYLKMLTLVTQSSEELAAHGLVDRLGPYEYLVTDILVYPQQTTAATVVASDDYSQWVAELAMDDTDDAFDRMRFQFHSHVNMGTNPSATDTSFYEDMLKDVQDFYIFFILNKRSEFWCNIYDIANNIIFEKEDIDVYIVDEHGNDIVSWAKDAITAFIQPRAIYAPTRFNIPPPAPYVAKEKEKEREKEKKPRGRPPKKVTQDTEYEKYYNEMYKRYGGDYHD